ncbi:hypothetical protein [Microbulbifer taiwanensis]|uniref:DUF4123 domain-containing protein n=1 Tax=Microbulbifer taiwanensis TaxID=986746 RepID=A0ABW1YKM3_9GAMM|nr:hypothetical protein [Microbulbifer taiwanensis]
MSEYQYYEFAAIDRPLSNKQQSELRACSTRATITATGFANEYHWGDLKGDPQAWMRDYFDAHVYFADWGTCSLLLRLPRPALKTSVLTEFTQTAPAGKQLCYWSSFESCATPDHWILGWHFQDEEHEHEHFWSEMIGSGWLGRLLPLREELLRGDTRPLYLGWLAGVCTGEIDAGEPEPPLPPGLQTLSAAQTALLDFLMIDPDWLAAAAAASPSIENPAATANMDAWLETQPASKLLGALRLVLEGKSQEAERSLRGDFLVWLRARSSTHHTPPRRTVAEIAKGKEQVRARRLEREHEEHAALEAKRRAEREKHLAQIARTPGSTWAAIGKILERGSGTAYDQALQQAKELYEAQTAAGREQDFRKGLAKLLRGHGRRAAWVRRLAKAGLL